MKKAIVALLVLAFALPAHAATIEIVNLDGPGEGFNDPTAATPVGGNPGVTIGEQRLNLFNHAADIWGALLPSNVTIRVEANFNPQSCDANGGVLGSAGPIEVFESFTGAEVSGVWYHVALANKLANVDLAPTTNDIVTIFNSSIDNNNNCLAGRNWYYGFDGNEGNDVELLPVLLHELGHGLGFSTFVSSNGQEFLNIPDIYEIHLLDNSTGQHWDDMTNAQRAASAINTDNVVWDGFATTFKAPLVLGGTPTLFINSGGGLPASFGVGTATFGPEVSTPGVTGDLVLVDDGVGTTTDACEALINGGAVAGNIAVIDRGSCTFTSKTLAAQAAGAIGVIIVNNVAGGTLTLGGTDPSVTIPAISVTLADGNLIKTEMGLGTVNATITLDPAQLAGADSNNRVKIYTPNPYQGGSSVSHWDTSAFPNLLMEPAITSSLSGDVDLTLKHFEDIGWVPRLTANPITRPERIGLDQNHPNPFNPSTTISFVMDRAGHAEISIYDVQGRWVTTLVDEQRGEGRHTVKWNGQDHDGKSVVSGVYLYRLKTADHEETRRMLLLK